MNYNITYIKRNEEPIEHSLADVDYFIVDTEWEKLWVLNNGIIKFIDNVVMQVPDAHNWAVICINNNVIIFVKGIYQFDINWYEDNMYLISKCEAEVKKLQKIMYLFKVENKNIIDFCDKLK
jgi:hypothetical protein